MCFLDALLSHISERGQFTTISRIEAITQFMHQHEYDSDAFLDDIGEVVIEATALNQRISNIYNICIDDNFMILCKDYMRYCQCM